MSLLFIRLWRAGAGSWVGFGRVVSMVDLLSELIDT